MKRIVVIAVLTLAALVAGAWWWVGRGVEHAAGAFGTAMGELNRDAIVFYSNYQRWPTSVVDLAEGAAKHSEAQFSGEPYATLTFRQQSNGSVVIDFVLATHEGSGSVPLPSIEEMNAHQSAPADGASPNR